MPNGDDYSKPRHGPHDFSDGAHDCRYGCGCWMGSFSSGGPAGLDPNGECPQNPLEGKGLSSPEANRDFVIKRRIRGLEARVAKAEDIVERTTPTKKQLAGKIRALEDENRDLLGKLSQIHEIIKPSPKRKKVVLPRLD